MKISKWCLAVAWAILCACNKQSHWGSDQIYSDDVESRSTKLTYFSKDKIHGIDMELIRIGQRLNIYLNTHSIPAPPYNGDPKKTLVKIKTTEGVHSFEAYRFEGGQKFLLPEEASQILISALQNREAPTLILPGYRTTIETEDFSEKFDRLNRPVSQKNPFHSPL